MLQATENLTPAGIWMAILLGHITRCTLSVVRFNQQKWRSILVGIEPPKPQPHLDTAQAEILAEPHMPMHEPKPQVRS